MFTHTQAAIGTFLLALNASPLQSHLLRCSGVLVSERSKKYRGLLTVLSIRQVNDQENPHTLYMCV